MFLLSKRRGKDGRTTLSLLHCCFFVLASCSTQQQPPERISEKTPFLEPEFWKNQTLNDILPFWTQHARDTVAGAFFSTLDADWKPAGDGRKFPSMIARQLFSYSVAYMLGGNAADLTIATNLKDYLVMHAWDKKYGGWFDALDRNGKPTDSGKSTFVQVYVITGLAMYYSVTHDKQVLDYINRSNDLLEQNVWDKTNGGYFDDIAQDWSVRTEVKSFASQLAPVSGYLIYLYMATRDERYLKQAERICDAVLRHMVDARTGWVLESFDKDWKYISLRDDEEEINVGHNIETAWSLARLYRLNNRKDFLESAKTLSDSLHRYSFNAQNGFWYYATDNDTPQQHTAFTYWWIQAYGNMFDLFLAGLLRDDAHRTHFVKGAGFWDAHFLDKQKGDTHFSVLETGAVKDLQKANQFKSSYHNVEHGFLNYLYLACWVNPGQLTLHFKIQSSAQGEKLHPLLVEKMDARVKEVRINGELYSPASSDDTTVVSLPALEDAAVVVTVE